MVERALNTVCRGPIILLVLLLHNGLWIPASAVQREQGMLEIQIKDHRDAISDFSKLHIVIEKLLISPKRGLRFWRAGWHELRAVPATIDLTQYVGGKGVSVYRGTIDAGEFEAFHLKVGTIDGQLKKDRRRAQIKNTVAPVQLSFEVRPQRETLLIIDLTVSDFSDHPPRGYELGLQGYELYSGGKLIVKIPPG